MLLTLQQKLLTLELAATMLAMAAKQTEQLVALANLFVATDNVSNGC